METATDNILNVTLLEPRLKHATIFARFDQLNEGETLTIHNDHDPKPLYYQLVQMRGDIFTWNYLEQGPEWWKIEIRKKKLNRENTANSSSNNNEENILNVTLLEPHLKHATIFGRFDQLKEGENLTIHNDHNPKPLYYHLLETRGDTFTWEYLEEGPEWWKVKISKRKITKEPTENKSVAGSVLNVTLLDPRVKHPTIFQYFDSIKEGEYFTIHNDHDPKPLYYQLLELRGDIFTWQYLEQGPEWWKIQITKKVIGQGKETLGEIATKDIRKAQVFKKYGLDFCCGGKKTVKEACEEKGINVATVEKELSEVEKAQTTRELPYNDWNLDFLADYIVNTHHTYVRKHLPDIRAYADKVNKVHGKAHPELNKVHQLVEVINTDFMAHMPKEEDVLFPYIKHLVTAKNNPSAFKKAAFGTVKSPINMMELEHETVGNALEEIRKITNNYMLPSDACASYTLLFRMLDEFEEDTHLHIHLENNILFPKAITLEETLSK